MDKHMHKDQERQENSGFGLKGSIKILEVIMYILLTDYTNIAVTSHNEKHHNVSTYLVEKV